MTEPTIDSAQSTSAIAPAELTSRASYRLGLATAAVVVGTYFWAVQGFSQGALAFLNRVSDQAFIPILIYVVTVAAVAVGVALTPSSIARRAIGVAVVVGIGLISALLTVLRFLPETGPLFGGGRAFVTFWTVVLFPPTIALFAAGLAWLIVRAAPPLGYLLLLATFVPGILYAVTRIAALPGAGVLLFAQFVALLIGAAILAVVEVGSRRRGAVVAV